MRPMIWIISVRIICCQSLIYKKVVSISILIDRSIRAKLAIWQLQFEHIGKFVYIACWQFDAENLKKRTKLIFN